MTNHFKLTDARRYSHLKLFSIIWQMAICTCMFVYVIFRLVFFDIPFETVSEMAILAKLTLTSTSFTLFCCLLIWLTDVAWHMRKQSGKYRVPFFITSKLLIAVVLLSCNGKSLVQTGTSKDLNTGMKTTYKNMIPEKVFLVMNNEVLNHTAIPIGASFIIVNDGIKGMKENEGKIAAGCALTITDSKGKILMSEKDLFAGHDEFAAQDANMLKCTVNTGQPMQWEEHYQVSVTFWDKYGDGKIENTVTIKSIDLP